MDRCVPSGVEAMIPSEDYAPKKGGHRTGIDCIPLSDIRPEEWPPRTWDDRKAYLVMSEESAGVGIIFHSVDMTLSLAERHKAALMHDEELLAGRRTKDDKKRRYWIDTFDANHMAAALRYISPSSMEMQKEIAFAKRKRGREGD